ncbi:MAG: hypothetical protein VX640_12680 [Pseudomonadota bacterium]|nr:hypothetical protein [Pseudomonadota bacterium]
MRAVSAVFLAAAFLSAFAAPQAGGLHGGAPEQRYSSMGGAFIEAWSTT